MVSLLTCVFFFLHMLSVQIAASAPLLAMLLPRTPDSSNSLLRQTLTHALGLLVAGVIAGVFLGVWLWKFEGRNYGPAFEIYGIRIAWAVAEVLFSATVIAILLWLLPSRPNEPWARGLGWLLALATCSNLLYHFPPLMTLIAERAESAAASRPTDLISSAAYRAQIFTLPVVAKTVHFTGASFAAGAAYLLGAVASRLSPTASIGVGDDAAKSVAQRAAMFAVAALLSQMFSGFWLLLQLPRAETSRLMGGDLWATLLLGTGVLLGMTALQAASALALDGATNASRCRQAASWIMATLFVMAALTR